MNRLFYTIALFACTSWAGFAQVTFTPTAVQTNPTAMETDVHGTVTVKNSSAATKTFKWERIVHQISTDGKTQVCDPVNCYTAATSTKNFTLDANASGTFQVHFLNSTGLLGCADVDIVITEIADPTNTTTAKFRFNDCAVVLDASELVLNDIKLFPNPVTESFTLENATGIATINVIALDGRQVATFTAAENGSYAIASLQTGTYFVVLHVEKGKAVKTVEVNKQ